MNTNLEYRKKYGSYCLLFTLILICSYTLNAYSGSQSEIQTKRYYKYRGDLDGDGTDDKVTFASVGPKEGGCDYSFVIATMDTFAVFKGECLLRYFEIVDIDTSDRFLEIAVPEEGQSDDYAVHYLRYSSGKILKLGKLPGRLHKSYTVIDGSGLIRTKVRGNILDTWWYWGEFKYDENAHDFKELPQSEYVIDRVVQLRVDLPLFREKDMSEVLYTVRKGERGKITKTDNHLWCLFEGDDGRRGWFPVKAGDIVHLDMVGYAVFDGLMLAD